MPTVALHTLGCRLNQAETAIIANKLKQRGFEIVEFGEQADLTIINTCTVTEQADSKCRQAVRQSLRKIRSLMWRLSVATLKWQSVPLAKLVAWI